jgi:two-component system OmpR family sensor kinase
MTLRLRLSIAAGLLLVVLGVAGYVLIGTVEASQLQQIDQELQTALPAAAVLSVPGTPPAHRPPLATHSALSDIYVAIVTKGHRNVSLDPTLAGDDAPRTPTTVSTLGHETLRPVTVDSLSGSERWRAVLISRPGTTQQVLVAVSMTRADATAGKLRLAVVTTGAILLIVLAAAAFWVARLGLRPIAEVTEVADSIAAGARSRRVRSLRSGTEAAHLARAFNVMLDEQEALEARLRQFVADASHELRTPVSAIQGFLQLWQQGHLREGQPFDDAVRRIGQESARMAGLVEDLLMLARLDEGQPLVRDRVDLAPLVDDVVLVASSTHPSRRIRSERDGPVVAVGDQRALRQVIANLVTNALTHTPSTASVTIHASACPGAVKLEVADTGPGMDAKSAAHAFDRFWRGDASRSRPGSGLGLPIVAGIVAAHGGQLKMKTAPGEGMVVQVVLPDS